MASDQGTTPSSQAASSWLELNLQLGKTTTARGFRDLAQSMGKWYMEQGNLPMARAWLSYAIGRNNTTALKMLADVCFEMGDFGEAAAHYREYVRQFE